MIRGTSQERFNHELGLEPLSILSLSYLQEILSSHNDPYYQTRSKSVKNIYINLGKKNNAFANFYFPHYIKKWFKLSVDNRFIESAKKVQKNYFWLYQTLKNSVYQTHDIPGFKLLTRSTLNFNHLNKHQFRHNFNDSINPMCSFSFETETTDHYLLTWERQ